MNRLKNKVAIITGAAGGLGAAEAILFAKEGAKILITDTQEEGLRNIADLITESGGTVNYMLHNLTSEQDWNQVVKKAVELYGAIHILINNVGVLGTKANNLDELSADDYLTKIYLNLVSQFIGIKAVSTHMKKNKGDAMIYLQ